MVSVHLSGCAECRARVGLFEAAGGALMDEIPVSAVRPDLFAATMRRIDGPDPTPPASRAKSSPLDGVKMTPWRPVGKGFHWRRLTLPNAPDANVMMLKVQPGQRMPHHTHVGTEYTQVMQGSFHDAFGVYTAGDCVEADDDIDHQPIVDSADDCICLAAVDGRLQLRGWLARMIQPLIGI